MSQHYVEPVTPSLVPPVWTLDALIASSSIQFQPFSLYLQQQQFKICLDVKPTSHIHIWIPKNAQFMGHVQKISRNSTVHFYEVY
jgi:hypothetical protein